MAPLSDTSITIISGGAAGLVETALSYPLDLAKTRQQLFVTAAGGIKDGKTAGGGGTLATLKGILARDGARGLYAGLSAPLVSEVPRRALKFGANGVYQRAATASGLFDGVAGSSRLGGGGGGDSGDSGGRDRPAGDPSKVQPFSSKVAQAFVCGGLTGATEALMHTPFERVKTQVQSSGAGVGGGGRYGGAGKITPLQCVKAMLSESANSAGGGGGAVRSLYRGLEAYAARQFVWNACFFAGIAAGKELTATAAVPAGRPNSQAQAQPSAPAAYTNFLIGLLSGSLATVANNPLDVVKTRVQAEAGPGNATTSSRWSVQIAADIYRAEGFSGWSRGLAARLYRSAPGHGLLYMSFEFISGHLRQLE